MTDLINDLQSFIIIFNKLHLHQIENYQSEAAYYINRRYKFKRRFSDNSNQSRTLYDRKKTVTIKIERSYYIIRGSSIEGKNVALYATELIVNQSIIFEKSKMHQKHN